MSTTPELDQEQLTAARAKAWRQDGNAVVTLEAARDWIAAQGLVLFAPRSAQLQTPAPSLVEATLGAANAAPTAAETNAARGFVARLAAEGLVVPLNLLGVPGELPDFVVSAQVFSYIFTLRGDKAWKVAPATGVSPLGVQVYETLAQSVKNGGGAMSAMQIASEVGREVTEAAISRTLTELWSQLRVIPVLETGTTQWELVSRRFTKAIKAGANAGQPTALSALVSLYLGQVLVATEEEVATFLSPLTARSRVRDVLHALMGARQLETLVVAGKTLLHIPGALPQFPKAEAAAGEDAPVASEKPKKVGTGRISSFKSEGGEASEFRGKPARTFGRPAAGARANFAPRPGAKGPGAKFGKRMDGKRDSERRPFKKAGEKPSFTKPWDENRPAKPRAAAPKDGFTKFRRPEPEDRAPLGPREQAGLPESKRTAPKASFDRAAPRTFDRKPTFGAKPYAKKTFGDKPGFGAKRPYAKRAEEDGERPAFKPRAYEGAGKTFAKKPYAAKDATGAKPFAQRPYERKTFGDKPAFGAKKNFSNKPSFAAKRPDGKRTEESGDRPAFRPRALGDAGAAAHPSAKRPYERKSFGDRPASAAKPAFAKRPYAKRGASSEPFEPGHVERTIAKRPHKPRAADADQRKFTNAPWVPPTDGGEKKRAFKPRSGGARKPFGAGAKRPFTRKKPGTEA